VLTLVSGQAVIVLIEAYVNTVSSSAEGYISYAVSGASTQAANDGRAARVRFAATIMGLQAVYVDSFVAGATGSHTFTMKYKAATGITTGFENRKIVVKKF
jgi:hypothetical protein